MSQSTQQRDGSVRRRKTEAVATAESSLRGRLPRQGVRIILIRDGQLVRPPENRPIR